MFNDDEDYGFLTGGLGDLDGDGRVDFVEYMNEEDDYQRIMHRDDDDDYSVLDDDEDIEMLSEAEELGIDPNDYIDNDEFEVALIEARENAAWKEEREDEALSYNLDLDDFDTEEEFDEAIEELENKAQNNEIDDSTFADDNVKAAMGAYAVAFASMKNKYGVSKNSQSNPSTSESTTSSRDSSLERRYYDRANRDYRIGDAIYDNFKEVSDNYEKHECEDFSLLIEKIYRVDKELGVTIWVWAIHNFPGVLANRGVYEWNSKAWSLTNYILTAFDSIDGESDDEKERTSIFRYVSRNPDLEDIIFNKTYVEDSFSSLNAYIPFCIENNLRDNFLRVYNGIMTNRFRKEKKFSKYSIIEDLLTFSNIEGVSEADPWFYAFFEKEIKAFNKPLKEAYLMTKLNDERYGKRIFLKPEKDNLELDDEYFGNSDTTDEISREEYKKLKNENKALKSKVTQLENKITDLNYCIQRLEKDLAAIRKPKEWDGKYYRYCKVVMDESPNGLWYRTDDITLKKGDYVYVPYGYKNEELMAKVVSVDEFRSDDLPVPLEKMKFIIEKCDA